MPPENPPNPRRPFGSGTPPTPGTPPSGRAPARPVVHRRPTPPPPIVAYEDVVAACGHPEKFGLFEDRKDRFRRDRRKKVTDRPCRACREKKRIEEEAAAVERKAEKQKRAQEAAMAQAQKPPKAAGDNPGRLPDGAKYDVVYNAAQTLWTGSLTVGDKSFSGSASGLFTLLSKLDRQYRQSLPPAPPANPS
ncbi:MAG: hypothetical protein JNM56_39310 [Planctomycetia bacterium]|nr:hypothetical protein [Planctomycetia bacterium]